MANYKKTYDKKGNVKLTELTPEEAKALLEEQENAKLRDKNKEAEPVHVEPEDRAAKEASLLGSTKEAIQLRKAEIKGELLLRKANLKGQIDTIKATETAKEKAGKHLAVFGALYLCAIVVGFLLTVTFMSSDNVAIAATLITLVVTQLSSILKTVVDTKEPKDPVELMSDVTHKLIDKDDYPKEV